ncbi:hypothetical protein [Luteibaculum oceani]|uniref:Uncharacterized protein n=1 Tax=Luteibaculum oceani TaxID=1294296 RepID=A0A5C6UXL3_9FLAO|nr:hypothetical protein [Luteibaculum oceani]TXC76981.1 hypothetical protein FRX97_10240 [Luteibaculum oceani]
MKTSKLLSRFAMLIIAATVFFACKKDHNSVSQINSDDELIAAIQSAEKSAITEADLPALSLNIIENDYDGDVVTEALQANGIGYEVSLTRAEGAYIGDQGTTYFSEDGRELRGKKKRKGRFIRKRLKECFRFVYPLEIILPDTGEVTLASPADWRKVKHYYKSNPDLTDRPEFVFPLEIVYKDSVVTITDQDQLEEAKDACRDAIKPLLCFKKVYPFTLLMPDGETLIELTERKDWRLVHEWHKNNPDIDGRGKVQFPVTIKFRDGSTRVINNVEEFEAAMEACKKD